MKKLVVLAFAAGSLAVASAPASAGDLSPGGAVALGALGGLAVGAAIGAAAQPLPPPPPRTVYVEPAPRRVYVERPVEETCVVERQRVWVPGWGWEVRRRTVCE